MCIRDRSKVTASADLPYSPVSNTIEHFTIPTLINQWSVIHCVYKKVVECSAICLPSHVTLRLVKYYQEVCWLLCWLDDIWVHNFCICIPFSNYYCITDICFKRTNFIQHNLKTVFFYQINVSPQEQMKIIITHKCISFETPHLHLPFTKEITYILQWDLKSIVREILIETY